jgi:hypothetical protein
MNVIRFKVDMLQALNISVDYVDADGDWSNRIWIKSFKVDNLPKVVNLSQRQ